MRISLPSAHQEGNNHRDAFEPFIFLEGMEAIYDFLCVHHLSRYMWRGPYPQSIAASVDKIKSTEMGTEI